MGKISEIENFVKKNKSIPTIIAALNSFTQKELGFSAKAELYNQ